MGQNGGENLCAMERLNLQYACMQRGFIMMLEDTKIPKLILIDANSLSYSIRSEHPTREVSKMMYCMFQEHWLAKEIRSLNGYIYRNWMSA